ncbi:hypothetical protein C8Q76DRAFT_770010 [Earliella scabrosa]|nr:hypothetical protein C8Q76DRAFT_770010 [Earliella scabrosa]
MNADCLLLHDLPRHRGPILLPPPPSTVCHQRAVFYPQDWRPQLPHSSLFAGPLAPSSWNNAGPSHPQSLWPNGPPEFLLPFHHYSSRDDRASFSVARSDTSSAVSRDSDLSPSPEVAQVVCNAPLVAPIPLPYHSPTFLLYDLPDEDEDLSHPPYTHRPHKRKRARDEDEQDQEASPQEAHPIPTKRRSIVDSSEHWTTPVGQWGTDAVPPAPIHALRHPAAAFSRRNRAR